MHYMIHACPQREWYVKDYLLLSLIDQGIPCDEITVWMDRDRIGNLASCVASFRACSKEPGETWHLQDDVIVSRDFAERTRAAPDGVCCGFCGDIYEGDYITEGKTTAWNMWQSSFPCIKIPNRLAGEFADWVERTAAHREDLREIVMSNKKDDTLFHIFMLEKHFRKPVTNIVPHLVDHIDWIIGGSTINEWRGYIVRSCRWDDENLIQELISKLADRR